MLSTNQENGTNAFGWWMTKLVDGDRDIVLFGDVAL
jgi:hypothetical protein